MLVDEGPIFMPARLAATSLDVLDDGFLQAFLHQADASFYLHTTKIPRAGYERLGAVVKPFSARLDFSAHVFPTASDVLED